MSAVSEVIVREYFEMHGFLVHQPRKYTVAARAKREEEEVDLLIFRPSVTPGPLPGRSIWTGADLPLIASAVVGVRGWHTERFSPAVLNLTPEVFRFTRPEAMRRSREILGVAPATRILCLPELPASDSLRQQTLAMIQQNGVDGVILFRTMLLELATGVETSKSYERSDLLQILRILKNYNLLKDAQLDLFRKRSPRRKST
jgi:hypothetical protein